MQMVSHNVELVRLVRLVKTGSAVYVKLGLKEPLVSHVRPVHTKVSLEVHHVQCVLVIQFRRTQALTLPVALAMPVILDQTGVRAQLVTAASTTTL
jgi:hypothetical protein